MTDAERRFTSVRVEIRAGSSDKRTIGGYAAKFNTLSQNLGGFKETLAPGVFNRAASRGWPGFDGTGVLARYNHQDDALLGSTASGSLRVSVNDTGLVYEVDMLDDTLSERVYKLVERGDVAKSSFAFIAEDDDWATDDTGYPVRTVIQASLGDVAPVNTPAYLDTSTAVRSLARKFDAPVEEVRAMQEAGDLLRFFKRTDGPTVDRVVTPQAVLAKAASLRKL